MSESIVVTHLSLVHALGTDPQEVFNRLAAGEQGLQRGPDGAESAVVPWDLRARLGAGAKQGFTRSTLLAGVACQQLWQAWKADQGQDPDPEDTGLVAGFTPDVYSRQVLETLASHEYQRMNPFYFLNFSANATASQLSILLGIRALILTLSSGFTAGLEALETGCQILKAGRAGAVAAGAVQESTANLAQAFSRRTGPRLSAPGTLAGWRPEAVTTGEGSAWLFLLQADEARRKGLRPRARVGGFGMAYNPEALGQGDPRACNEAIAAALADAGWEARDVGVVFLAANGDPAQDQAELQSIKSIFGNPLPSLTAVKGALGETWHAAGAFSAVIAILSLENHVLVPTHRPSSPERVRELGLPLSSRPLDARRALVLALDSDRKAMACLLETA
jgi:3-oxoacyl-[acyl-carrier-protein] synthase II